MPLLTSYDWAGIPGIVVAAPTIQVFDVAYSEQQIKEQWKVCLTKESYDITTPWAIEMANQWWAEARPWWIDVMKG